MNVATRLPAVKAELIARLQALPALAGVHVSYDPPLRASDVKNADGDFEAVWFDVSATNRGDGDADVVILKSLPIEIDTTARSTIVVQVLRPRSDAVLADVEQRAAEILGEVYGVLAADPSLGFTGDDYLRCELLPDTWELIAGQLPDKPGYGARFEQRLALVERLAFA